MIYPKGLYIHFPYCKRECFYCHFTKFPQTPEKTEKYINYLVRELEMRSSSKDYIDTIYFGGGSPSLMSPSQMGIVIDAVRSYFKVSEYAEITFEMNPGDIDGSLFREFRDIGLNRVSIGCQSFCSSDLKFLKRAHSVNDNYRAIDSAIEGGFENISVDIIVGLPEQNICKSIDSGALSNVSHSSVYILEQVEKGWYKSSEEEEIKDSGYYFEAQSFLEKEGLSRYEVSNFSKPGRESQHNLKYWKNGEYIGTGISASGFEGTEDYRNFDTEEDYFSSLDKGQLPISSTESMEPDLRTIITGLRLYEGVSEKQFRDFQKPLEFCIEEKLLLRKRGNILVNPEKILILNGILGLFIED